MPAGGGWLRLFGMRGAIASVGLVVLASQAARADTLPWVDPGDVPLPSGVQSVEIVRHDEPLLVRPRGPSAALSTRPAPARPLARTW